jgi:hypothetical protein
MSPSEATEFIHSLRPPSQPNSKESCRQSGWQDRRHIATSTFRRGVIRALSQFPERGDADIALVELHLSDELPGIDCFEGILGVDERGIWYFDGDGDVEELPWRQSLIPWARVKGITLHRVSPASCEET